MKYSSADAGRFRVVRVFDGFGNEQRPTYPKRAKGLIKNGRAQWLSEDSIVLIELFEQNEPVSDDHMIYSEDKTMSELYKDITVTALLERLASLGNAVANCNDAELMEIAGKLYADTLFVIKDIKKQNQEITLAKLSSGSTVEFEEDETLQPLLQQLEELGNAAANCNDAALMGIAGNLYSETLNVIKDLVKQSQEVVLAKIKAEK